MGEKYVFPVAAKWIGLAKVKLNPRWKKKRKEYKLIAEDMKI
jgi:cation-transporting ATPase 13A3/4/5